MQKININGRIYIRLREIREEIRWLRKNIDTLYGNFDEDHRAMVHLAYNDIIRAIYREELKKAKTPEEIKAIYEMPGDFVVISGTKKEDLRGFIKWEDGKAVIGKVNECLIFDFESKAEEIAEQLGEGWRVMDISPEEHERTQRLLRAIFSPSETEYTEEDAEEVAKLADEFLKGNDSPEAQKLKENIRNNTADLFEEAAGVGI